MKRNYNNMTKAELIKIIKKLENGLKRIKKENSAQTLNELEHLINLKDSQIETQKYELMETQVQLEASRDKYADLYDFAPTGYVTLNSRGIIEEINLTGASMLSVDAHKVAGIPFMQYLAKDDFQRFLQYLKKCRHSVNHCIEKFTLNKNLKEVIVQLIILPYQDYKTKKISFRVSITDITKKDAAERALYESEERFRLMADASPSLIWMTDADNNLEYMNRTKLDFLGLEFNDLAKGQEWLNTRYADDREKFAKEFDAAAKKLRIFTTEVMVKNSKGESRWLLETGAPRFLKDGTFAGYIGSGIDITESRNARIKLEEALREKEALLRELKDYKYALDQSSIVAITDQKGIIKHANDNFCKISKYSKEELLGQDHRIINSKFHPKEFIKDLWQTIGNGKVWRGELRNRAKDGSLYWVNTTIIPFLNEKGKPYQYVAIRNDITEKQVQQIKLEKSLKDKEVLLKEIHHRVKNNLQVISSLLNLQRGYIHDESMLNIFRSSQSRISAMALIHEKLYGSENLSNIDFKDYVFSITKNLLETYRNSTQDIKINLDIEDIALTVDTSINFGLIINELVSNSLKYAFQKKEKGIIDITLYRKKNNKLVLKVSDNGIGLPENFKMKRRNSLGLELVSNIVEQLQGKLEISKNGKTEFKISV
ncbi:MAG: PAS domain S-box protein [Ignavibacteriales bacterium]|nr:MAG: PAS domain S-box protein [Ignavibacteriales bacterium]